MTSGRAQHIDQEIRRAIDNLRLVTESICRQHKTDQLTDLFDVVETRCGVHLRQNAERCLSGSIRGLFDSNFVRTATRQELIAIPGDLTSNVKQRAAVADRNQSGLDIRCGRRRRSGKCDAEFTQPFMWCGQSSESNPLSAAAVKVGADRGQDHGDCAEPQPDVGQLGLREELRKARAFPSGAGPAAAGRGRRLE